MMDVPRMISIEPGKSARTSRVFCIGVLFGLVPAFGPTAEAGGITYDVRVNGDAIQLAAGQYDITTTIDTLGKQVTLSAAIDGADLAFILGNFGDATDATTAP